MNFYILLLMAALGQMLGGMLTWLALKGFSKRVKLLVILEVLVMLLLSIFLLYEGLRITPYVIVTLFIGVLGLHLLNIAVPHKHSDETQRLGFLVFVAMALHEFPEGIAYAASFLINPLFGLVSALSITAHNIPEGAIVFIPYILNNKIKKGFTALALTQLLYIGGGLLAYFLLIELSQGAQALAMTFAAGAMIYIVMEELRWLRSKKP